MITVTADEIQNNFAKYLQAVQDGDEILIMIDERRMARLSLDDPNDPDDPDVETLSDILKINKEYSENYTKLELKDFVGVLKGDYDYKKMRDERYEEMRKKYESLD